MGIIATTANTVFRDYVTDGVSASGFNDPDKADIRDLFGVVDAAVAAATEALPALDIVAAGADPTYSADCTSILLSVIATAKSTGQSVYIPAGRYKCSNQVLINIGDVAATGLTIYGDGRAKSILDFRTCTVSPNLYITASIANQTYVGDGSTATFAVPSTFVVGVRAVTVNGTPVSFTSSGTSVTLASPPASSAAVVIYPALDNDYVTLRDLGIIGQLNGVLVQLGRSDFLDPVNVPDFDRVNIQNFSTAGSAIALQLNYVLGGKFKCVVNGGGIGQGFAAVDMHQACFNAFEGSYGTSSASIYMRDGSNYGNTFNAPDFENAAICFVTDSDSNFDNVCIAGRWSYSSAGVNDLRGSNLRIVAPNMGPTGSATNAGFVAGRGTGVLVDSIPEGVSPPSITLSTTASVAWTNNTGYRLQLYLWGGANVSSISVDGLNIGLTSGSFLLYPGQAIAANYSGSGGYTKPTVYARFV